MGEVILRSLKSGLATQLQDSGRSGHQHLGVPSSGAMDRRSAADANWLVGNSDSSPVVEITLWGPELEIDGACQLALTGGDLSATLNGQAAKTGITVEVSGLTRITFGEPKAGSRAYLSIGGEWHVKRWLGSAAPAPIQPETLTPDSWLTPGKRIRIEPHQQRHERQRQPPAMDLSPPIRILPGPESDDDMLQQLVSRRHAVSGQSNRMGYRLDSALSTSRRPEMISSAVVPGTIQIMPSGQPVILMADAQTIGGYPRVAHVIGDDMDRLAQAKPGDEVSFALVEG